MSDIPPPQTGRTARGSILVCSAGAKSPLILAIREAVTRLGPDLRVLTSDADPEAPAHSVGLGRIDLPHIGRDSHEDPSTIAAVARCLHQADVRLVIPTRDGELSFWSHAAESLRRQGVEVVVSPQSAITLALDKVAFDHHGREQGLPTIPTAAMVTGSGPFVVKERYGAGARDILLRGSAAEAREHVARLNEGIVQPFIEGEEFSADAWIGSDGTLRGPVLRRRDEITDGEARITTTVRDATLEQVATALLESLPLRGPVNVQMLRTPAGAVHIIELNARFGGAMTCSIAVGLDVWGWELQQLTGVPMTEFVRREYEVRQTRRRDSNGLASDTLVIVPPDPARAPAR